MPTILILGPYRFHFYSTDRREPPHVHVTAPDGNAKFWLQPVSLAFSEKLNASDLRKITVLVHQHSEDFLEAWHDYFDD